MLVIIKILGLSVMNKIGVSSQNMCSNKAVIVIKLLFINMKPAIGKERVLSKGCGGETQHVLKAG